MGQRTVQYAEMGALPRMWEVATVVFRSFNRDQVQNVGGLDCQGGTRLPRDKFQPLQLVQLLVYPVKPARVYSELNYFRIALV